MEVLRLNDEILKLNGNKSEIDSAINLLLSSLNNINYEIPEYPKWDDWSEKIHIHIKARNVRNVQKYYKSGVYRIYLDDKIIYIGESRCDNQNFSKGRKGMWNRRSDFRSTILGNNIRNPYGNGSKFLELFGREMLNLIWHDFHPVHSLFCKQSEIELLQDYYNEHGKLPALQSESVYKKIYQGNTISEFLLDAFI